MSAGAAARDAATALGAPSFVGRAPGKIILLGEHAVVYGYRAIAAAVDLYTTVTIVPRPGRSQIDHTRIADERLGPALAQVIPAEGASVRIESDLPVGCGMGSSAALAVAAVRAAAAMAGRSASFAECYERGFLVERVFHGNPSGLDHAVSAIGAPVIYRRGETAEALTLASPLRLVVANTGTPGNTAEMVESVRQRAPDAELLRLGALVEMTAARLARGEPVGEFFREAQWLLRRIGVSTRDLDELCRAMEAAGSPGAKLAGAGGGGIAIALASAETEDAIVAAAERLVPGRVWRVTIAGSGWSAQPTPGAN